MATPRDVRRLAFQALFQLDSRGEGEIDQIREALSTLAEEDRATFRPADCERAMDLAIGAFRARRDADALSAELAPTWPAARQPAVDRAIIRLAIHEMTSGITPPKVAVNEAVELAKRFSTEKSPAFVNGVLDKVLKRLRPAQTGKPDPAQEAASQ